jgi:hypothetical protein
VSHWYQRGGGVLHKKSASTPLQVSDVVGSDV